MLLYVTNMVYLDKSRKEHTSLAFAARTNHYQDAQKGGRFVRGLSGLSGFSGLFGHSLAEPNTRDRPDRK